MVKKRLFIHPTFDCSFDKVCREDCYLLSDKSDEDKTFRLPDSYWAEIVAIAGDSGFRELSFPINPLKGVTGVTDPLHWLRLLAPIARNYQMTINVTTTLEVAALITADDQVDTVAISLDNYRVGPDWKRKEKKVTRVTSYLRSMGIETNCNLSIDEQLRKDFTVDYGEFLSLSFDYINPVFAKLSNDTFPTQDSRDIMVHREYMMREIENRLLNDINPFEDILSQVLVSHLSHQEGLEYYSEATSIIQLIAFISPDNPKIIPDYCVAFRTRDNQCDAGYGQLSLDAFGRIAICPYNPHEYDASTAEKFSWYLEEILTRAHHITACNLIDQPALGWARTNATLRDTRGQTTTFDSPPTELRERLVLLLDTIMSNNMRGDEVLFFQRRSIKI